MKKTILSLLLLVVAATVNAQSLLVGDSNQDGELTLSDVTKTTNMLVGKEGQTVIDLTQMAYTADNSAVVGTWYLDEDAVTFSADGTTSFMGAASYKFLPLQGTIILYDAAARPISVINVVDITQSGLLLMLGGTPLNCSSTPPPVHEYVDLGLPSGTLWATTNIGANNPEDYGDYFAWGETTGYMSGKRDFSWGNYKYCNGSNKTLTKYCTNSSYGYNGFTDNLTELEPEDDAAYVNWGRKWRTPSRAQLEELINSDYTTTTWTSRNGVNGRLITSKSNNNSIFLPAAGERTDTYLYYTGSDGSYWTRTLNTSLQERAFYLIFYSSFCQELSVFRYLGNPIRPVRVQ